jgi:hypothetical protein
MEVKSLNCGPSRQHLSALGGQPSGMIRGFRSKVGRMKGHHPVKQGQSPSPRGSLEGRGPVDIALVYIPRDRLLDITCGNMLKIAGSAGPGARLDQAIHPLEYAPFEQSTFRYLATMTLGKLLKVRFDDFLPRQYISGGMILAKLGDFTHVI